MAIFVMRAGYQVTRGAYRELVDAALPQEEQEIIARCISEHNTRLVSFHAMRTRRAGNERFIDLHLVMPRNLTVEQSHRMCDHLEKDIKSRLANTNISIHVEPCNGQECSTCHIKVCSLRLK